jgi:hypothetical protein
VPPTDPPTTSPLQPVCAAVPQLAALCTLTEQGRTQLCAALAVLPLSGTPLATLCDPDPTPAELQQLITLLTGSGQALVPALAAVVQAVASGNPLAVVTAVQALLSALLGVPGLPLPA